MARIAHLANNPVSKRAKSEHIHGAEIEGAQLRSLSEHKDHRGSFTELFRDDWETVIDPVQWSVVRSEARVFRGCHLHKRHDEFFAILEGTCLVGLRDLRPWSKTTGATSLYRLHGTDLAALSFPRGVVHGWYFFETSIHVQAVSESFDDYGADDNLGCRWDDPDLNIPWGIQDVILSERAAAFPSLKQLIADAGFAS